MAERIKQLEKESKLRETNKEIADEERQILIQEAELQERIASSVQDIQEVNRQQLTQEQERLKLMQSALEISFTERENLTESQQQQLKIQEELERKYGSIAAAQAEINKLVDGNNERLKISNKQGKEYRSSWESIATHVGMSSKGFAGLIRSSVALNEELKISAAKQEEFALAFKSVFNVTNLAAGVFTLFTETMVKNLILLDKVSANFAAATGAGRGFSGVIQEAQANNRQFNVSLEESGKATQALFEGFIGFRGASDATQTSLVELTSQLGKFGVDGTTAANVLNFFSTNLGKSTEESAALTKQLAMMGPRIGISTSKITKDFQASLPTLAVYGDRAIDVFQGIAGSARLAGVETSKMLDLANKFDTFSDSAETAGKLNAILGTQISAQEMLMATESERIEMLIRSTQATGVAFDQLGRFEQKAIAAAAGISDLSEAQRIFGMDLAEFQKQQATLDKSAKVQEDFNNALEAMIPLKEKFMSLFSRFVPIVTPFLEGMHSILDAAGDFLETFEPETLRAIGTGIMALAGGFVAVKAVAAVGGILSSLSAGMNLIAAAGPAAGAGGAAAGRGISAFLSAIATPQAALGLLAITAAISALIGVYSLYQNQVAKQDEAKARQVEGNVALAESFTEIGSNLKTLGTTGFEKPIAGLQLMAQALGKFQDVDVDARATLTNLALISAGKAADSAQNAKIVAAGAVNVSNVNNNSFAPSLVLEIDGEQFEAKVKSTVFKTATATG